MRPPHTASLDSQTGKEKISQSGRNFAKHMVVFDRELTVDYVEVNSAEVVC